MIEIFGRPDSSNAAKVFWLLEEIGTPFTLIPAGRGHGPTDTPEFRALNPFGLVPVLREGEAVVWESNAVLRYLARRFPETGFWPGTPAAQAVLEGWMDWASISLTPPLTALRKRRAAGESVAQIPAPVLKAFAALDARLAVSDFIAGPQLGLADITAAPAVHRWFLLEDDRPELPHLGAYARRLAANAGYRRHIRDALS